jgi:hypothetical protein
LRSPTPCSWQFGRNGAGVVVGRGAR